MLTKTRLIIPKRTRKIALPKPNNLTAEQAAKIVFIRYEKALERLSKV